ncbi:MAG TPA: hypothetical protein VMT99_00880 [Candidatus Paceibacterota bacterium]|nr:hypothetical protein [Candidatus Paceibacterota bacterium]
MIVCLGVSNISLDHAMRESLMAAVEEMALSSKTQHSFKSDTGEGQVRKVSDFVSFFGEGGPCFAAEVDTDRGTGKASFIVPQRYIDAVAAGAKFDGGFSLELDPKQSRRAQWN